METLQASQSVSWADKTKKLRILFPAITDHDLYYNDGKERVMIDKLAYKLGKSTDELRFLIHAEL